MAERVADALDARRPLLVEAGTGTGKTLAYLVPGAAVGPQGRGLAPGRRTLQEQIARNDLPLPARRDLPRPFTRGRA